MSNVYELESKLKYDILPLPITEPNSLFSKMIMTMWEKFGTSGRGMGVGSSSGVDTISASEMAAGVGVGSGSNVTGRGGGEDSVKAGWQAEARIEARAVIHKRRIISFMSASFLEFGSSTSETL